MKYLITFLLTVVIMLSSKMNYAQSAVLSNNKFEIELAKTKIQLSPGASEDIAVLIGRGKKYLNEEVEFVVNNIPSGLTIQFAKPVTTEDRNTVTVTTAKDLNPGTYMLVVYGRIDQTRKGVALAVKVI